MSDIASAYYDDIEEWHRFCRMANIPYESWSVYSKEADHAKKGYDCFSYKGSRLKLYVKHCMEREKLENKIKQEEAEFSEMIKLNEKYGN